MFEVSEIMHANGCIISYDFTAQLVFQHSLNFTFVFSQNLRNVAYFTLELSASTNLVSNMTAKLQMYDYIYYNQTDRI